MRKLKKLLIIPILGLLFLVSSCALFSDIQNAFNINGRTGTGSTPQSSQTTGGSGSASSQVSSEGATSSQAPTTESTITGTEIIIDDNGNYDFTDINYNRLYGYNELGKQSKASSFQKMYRSLFNDLQMALKTNSDYTSETRVTYEYSKELTEDEATIVYSTLMDDNPQFCFLNSGFSTSISSSILGTSKTMILTISPDFYSAENRLAIVTKLNQHYGAIKTLLNEKHLLPISSLSPYQISKEIHDYLCSNLEYAKRNGVPETASWAHSIMGLLDYNKGVCECYAECYLLFSYAFGIESVLVSGQGDGGAGFGAHAWNYTKAGDSWYLVDVTWDDQTTTRYTYFLAGSNTTSSDHIPNPTDFDHPVNEYDVITFQITLPELSQTNYSIL